MIKLMGWHQMANEEHLAILRQGVEVWNKWMSEKIPRGIDLLEAKNQGIDLGFPDLDGAELREANLSKADLRGANLRGTNLSESNLVGADLRHANLSQANLSKATLIGAALEYATLTRSDLRKAKLGLTNFRFATFREVDLSDSSLIRANLFCTDLTKANLNGADLSEANLNVANFSEASLLGADLSAVQALGTNFTAAKFTGACIGSWNINSATRLDEIECQHIYLGKSFEGENQERRPSDSNTNFAPGEFTKLYRKALEAVDLILTDGLDWVAFLNSFQKLQVQCGSDELFIQAFENKGDAFVIRVGVPLGADKAEIEKFLKRQYELETQLEAQKQLTQANYRHCADLKEIAMLLAGRTINVEARAVAESQSMSEAYQSKYDQRGANIGSNVDTARDNARVQSILHNYAPEQRQSLVEAAAEIQQLLQQLEQSYPTNTPLERQAVVTEAIRHIESNPTLKARVIGALKKAGTEGIKELVDHPLINIFLAAVEGWQEP